MIVNMLFSGIIDSLIVLSALSELQNVLPVIPQNIWEMAFGWMPFADSCSAAGGCKPPVRGAIFYGLIGIGGLLLGYPRIKYAFGSPETTIPDDIEDADGESVTVDEVELSDDGDESVDSFEEDIEDNPVIASLKEIQDDGLTPPGIDEEYNYVRVGESYRKQMFVEDCGDILNPGLLRKFFAQPDIKFDMSIEVSPLDRDKGEKLAEKRAEAYDADIGILSSSNQQSSQFAMSDKAVEAQRAKEYRDELKQGQRPFEYTIYISARGDSEKELENNTEKIRDTLERNPTDWTLTTIEGEQLRALKSMAPTGRNVLKKEAVWDPEQVTVGNGIGAFFSSMSESRIMESSGVELGEHAINGSPMIKDPFKSETNYNQVVIGDSGSGKSFDTKLQALRTWESREDVMLIMLDPLNGFHGLAEALDAEHITVGGDRGLNPLDIKQPAEQAQEALPDDYNALREKEQEVLEFFDTFFNLQGIDIGNARPLLGTAVREAYEAAGIKADIDTHDKPSPTISDVIDILDTMSNNPQEYTVRGSDEAQKVADTARSLKGHLRLFEDGQYQNLNADSDFDLRGEDVVYVDLSQQEGQSGGGSGLMMQLMFSLIYEQAKQTPENVMFIIDEARFLMRETESLEFLGQRVRHSRHFNTSIRFITQNIGDFFENEEAESIINNSFMFTLHRTKEVMDWTNEFGINARQAEFIEDAATGDEGYSEALVRINEQWYPIQVAALPREASVVDFDPREQEATELPGIDRVRDDPMVRAIQKRLREGARQPVVPGGEPPIKSDAFDEAWQELSDEQMRKIDVLNGPELLDVLRAIGAGAKPEIAINRKIVQKLDPIFSDLSDGASESAARLKND